MIQSSNQKDTLQNTLLNKLQRTKEPVTLFLVNGVKLQGIITGFDNFSVLLRRGPELQLVYKHAISTVMPLNPIQLFDGEENKEESTQ